MKNLSELQKCAEKKLNVKFENFLTEPNKLGIFYPKRAGKPRDSRFWFCFKKKKDTNETIFIAGDFKDDSKKFAIPIDFKPPIIAKKQVSDEEYLKNKITFRENLKNLLINKGFNQYLDEFKTFEPTCFIKNKILYVPYANEKGTVESVLKIYEDGKKYNLDFSEPSKCFHIIRNPKEKKKSFFYICEGIRTAYTVLLGCNENDGVLSAGSFSNIEEAIKYVIKLDHYPVLCTEKDAHDKYLSLKIKYGCYLVGSKEHEDIYDFYKDTNLEILKNSLKSFRQNTYIPLGLNDKNKIVCYLKSTKMVVSYNQKEKAELYNDTHNTIMPPKNEILNKFYWETRMLCRKIGPVKNYNKIKEGIFPHFEGYYYYDTTRVYKIKKKGIKKIDPMSIISSDCVLCKDKNYNFPDLTKLKPLNDHEFMQILKKFKNFQLNRFRL